MPEKQKLSHEKQPTSPRPGIDPEKVIAGNIFQADALRQAVKPKHPRTLRSSTDNIQTQFSQKNQTVIREAKAGNSIDV